MMITIATLLWDWNERSESFSRVYDETWVEKLYRQCERNLTMPFRFVCFTDRRRTFMHSAIRQQLMTGRFRRISYGDCIEPFSLGAPMILMGLDTVILRNIDHLAKWTLDPKHEGIIALPRDPYNIRQACNGVVLSPGNRSDIWNSWAGHNDMAWLRQFPHVFIDDVFPGSVKSFKGHVLGQTGLTEGRDAEPHSIDDIDIVFFHGNPKMHELGHLPWIKEHWR